MALASLAFRLRRVNEVPLVEMVRLTLWKRGVKGVAVMRTTSTLSYFR